MLLRTDIFILFFLLSFILISLCFEKYYEMPAEVLIRTGRTFGDASTVDINTDCEARQLHLKPMENIWEDGAKVIHVTRDAKRRRSVEKTNMPFVRVYHDKQVGSILTMHRRKLCGIVDLDYRIKNKDGRHFVFKVDKEENNEFDYEFPPNDINDKVPLRNKIRYRMLRSSNFYPEIAVIVDSTLAKLIGNSSQIYEYLTIFWNGVKKRFETIEDLKIEIRLVGVVIVRDPFDERYFGKNYESIKYLPTMEILKRFSWWVFKNTANLPVHDILFLQSGNDISTDKKDTNLAGLTYVKGACKKFVKGKGSFSVGIGEDIGAYYLGVRTAAHEIGHLLGANHDNDKNAETQDCNSEDGFLMSNNHGPNNHLLFSNCSIRDISSYLASDSAACLRIKTIRYSYAELLRIDSLPGEVLNMTTQCKFYTGKKDAYVYAKENPEDNLCYKLKCMYKKGNKIYTVKTTIPAAEGSKCPSGKYCFDGKCV